MVQTQTIDFTEVQKILKQCPYYDQIVKYEYAEGDYLSEILIDWYKDLIFSANPNEDTHLKIINAIDKSLYLYVKDNKYKRGLKKVLDENDIKEDNQKKIIEVIKKIIMFTNSYEEKEILDVSSAKWL